MFRSRFLKERRGAIAVKFAIMAPLFVGAVGAAIEYARAVSAQGAIQQTVDAATLAATRMLALDPSATDADLSALIAAHIDASDPVAGGLVSCVAPRMQVDRVEVAVTVDLNCTVDTILPTSVDEFNLIRSAGSDFNFDALDVSFMVDVSGSMGGSRIRDLREALSDAVEIFLNESRSDVRIAMAPYSWSVNAGPYADTARGVNLSHNCVTERRQSNGGNAYNDAPPSTQVVGRATSACPTAEILPLTDNEALIRSRINGLETRGMTAGHLGIAWSWYLISSRWSDVWPAASRPLAAGEGRKAVVIMTDGMFNQRFESTNGNSSRQAERVCQSMRDEGVLVFSVGFRAPNSVKGTLRNCATTPAYFFDSNNGDELKAAYKAIAEELTTHNLVQ